MVLNEGLDYRTRKESFLRKTEDFSVFFKKNPISYAHDCQLPEIWRGLLVCTKLPSYSGGTHQYTTLNRALVLLLVTC